MHLSIVNKEMVGIKEETICKNLKKKPDETKALHQCEICSKTFSEKKSLKRHISSVHEETRSKVLRS